MAAQGGLMPAFNVGVQDPALNVKFRPVNGAVIADFHSLDLGSGFHSLPQEYVSAEHSRCLLFNACKRNDMDKHQ